ELDAIENYKKMIDQNQEVFVSLLAGVPEGYAEGAAELEYRDDDDAEAHALYGIGPGCDGDGGPARPPVRMRELVEAFATGEEQLIHSVCAPDFDAAIERFADALADELRPACMKSCVADTDPDTPVLDADCDVVHESAVTGTRATVLECEVDPSGALTPPTDETICYALRHDAEGLTASP
ncbi:MAG: hypothetical protein KC457_37285, partial [Myxococcales bacterium]|nr:hypothetical protein [Myxococcales bacterium]